MPAGGLLGRQIKLINYDTQSNMQLYTQFCAAGGALKDKVCRRAWRQSLRPRVR